MRRLIGALLLVLILAGAAAALSGPEYREMMKDPGFAGADAELNQVWSEAKKVLPQTEFEALRRDQKEWVLRGRQAEVEFFMAGGMTAVKAYTRVTDNRVQHLRSIVEDGFLIANPVGAQGFYVRSDDDGSPDGWMRVHWRDRNGGDLEVSVEAILVLNPENVRSGSLSGRGALKDGSVEIVDDTDDGARMTVTFEGDTATVVTTDAFKQSGWCGMYVVLDGVYVRQRTKK